MFENKKFEGIYYSRFISSWINGGFKLDWRFKEWLGTLTINNKPIPEDIIQDIYNLGVNGKMELELSAKQFMARNKEES